MRRGRETLRRCGFRAGAALHPLYAPIVSPIFEAMASGRLEAVTSALSLLEVLVIPYRKGQLAIAELAHQALAQDFRRIDPHSARVILVEAGPRILSTFPEALACKAKASLTKLGVEVREKTAANGITADGAQIGGEWIAARTIIWSAGVSATPVAQSVQPSTIPA